MMWERTVVCLIAVGVLSGCAGRIEQWIVNTRLNQGDVALSRGSLHEAQTAYRLALRISPRNPRARAGLSQVSADIADADYRSGDYDDALATIDLAAKYDPSSVRLQGLRSEVSDAKIKRQIVISNYPTYALAGFDIQTAYGALGAQNTSILKSLKKFAYTYDTQDLTTAIQDSYELQLDVAKNTNRLIAYRQLVESGVPTPEKSDQSGPTQSLLPLP